MTSPSLPDLLLYVEQLLGWRAETWSPLPACIEAFLVGSLASRLTGDFVTLLALAWAPGERGQNPFYPDAGENFIALEALSEALGTLDRAEIDRLVAENYQPAS